jgi:hypothetical protein
VWPPAPLTSRPALLNAAAAFVLATIVNVLLHELAHAVAGLAQGLTATLLPFSVNYAPPPSPAQEIVTALAGPVWSLVMGAVLLAIAQSWGTGFPRLFWLWLGFMGVMNFVGYLEIAPFVSAGDTGRALTLLHAPGWVFILVSLVGVAMQFGLAYLFARQVKRYTNGIEGERVLAFRAWAIGTLINVVLVTTQLLLATPEYGLAGGRGAVRVRRRDLCPDAAHLLSSSAESAGRGAARGHATEPDRSDPHRACGGGRGRPGGRRRGQAGLTTLTGVSSRITP